MMRGSAVVPDEAFAYYPLETGTASCTKFAGDGAQYASFDSFRSAGKALTLRHRVAILSEQV